jgi:nucleotide-binding universal stress UspA family protein
MRYGTILLHVDHSPGSQARITAAAALARQHGAHLIGAAVAGLGGAGDRAPGAAVGRPPHLAAGAPLTHGASRADALAQFQAIVGPAGISYESRCLPEQAEDGLRSLSRFADLVVLGQPGPAGPSDLASEKVAEGLILGSGRPVLIIPSLAHPLPIGQHILLAWDGSIAAALAMSHALPLLVRAAKLIVLQLLSREADDPSRRDCADLGAYLGRHGVQHQIVTRTRQAAAGKDMLAFAQAADCDTLVMGAYSHSPFHELLLGGASRTVFARASCRVLAMHAPPAQPVGHPPA